MNHTLLPPPPLPGMDSRQAARLRAAIEAAGPYRVCRIVYGGHRYGLIVYNRATGTRLEIPNPAAWATLREVA